jgi:hypothetical protein
MTIRSTRPRLADLTGARMLAARLEGADLRGARPDADLRRTARHRDRVADRAAAGRLPSKVSPGARMPP